MNRHLNFFSFYNDHQQEYIENNLSRAFALCLRNSPLFLDKVLNWILPEEEYKKLFSLDVGPNKIEIDIQANIDGFDSFSTVIGVGCSGKKYPDYSKVERGNTNRPIPDVSVVIGDVAIVFEFKPNDADPRPQVLNQVAAIAGEDKDQEKVTKIYRDFSWRNIVEVILNVLTLHQSVGKVDPILRDFRDFLEMQFPQWFPVFQLSKISAPPPGNGGHPRWKHIGKRINHIKRGVYGKDAVNYISGQFSRYVIAKYWGWAKEQHVDICFRHGEPTIAIGVYPGDTKRQGLHLFTRKDADFTDWPKEICGFRLIKQHYLKFSHFNSGLFWYEPHTDAVIAQTHQYDFFHTNAGRWKKESWGKFESVMDEIDPDWKSRCGKSGGEYESKLKNSNRNYFDLSVGIYLEVRIPYKAAQALDNAGHDFTADVRDILDELKRVVDQKTRGKA